MLTEATRGENVPELWEKIEAHRAYLEDGRQLEERRRAEPRRRGVRRRVRAGKAAPRARCRGDPELARLLDEVQRRELDPLTAVREILEKVFHIGDDGDSTQTR